MSPLHSLLFILLAAYSAIGAVAVLIVIVHDNETRKKRSFSDKLKIILLGGPMVWFVSAFIVSVLTLARLMSHFNKPIAPPAPQYRYNYLKTTTITKPVNRGNKID